MNRKTLSIAFTLVLVVMVSASLIGPAQACRFRRRTKIPVTVVRGNPKFGDIEICEKGDWYFVKAEVAFGTYIITGNGIHLEKQPSDTLGISRYFLNNGEGFAISMSNLNFEGGNFKGVVVTKGLFGIVPAGPMAGMPFPLDVIQKGVWQGYGDYEGWTFVLKYTTGDDPITGYLLVP